MYSVVHWQVLLGAVPRLPSLLALAPPLGRWGSVASRLDAFLGLRSRFFRFAGLSLWRRLVVAEGIVVLKDVAFSLGLLLCKLLRITPSHISCPADSGKSNFVTSCKLTLSGLELLLCKLLCITPSHISCPADSRRSNGVTDCRLTGLICSDCCACPLPGQADNS